LPALARGRRIVEHACTDDRDGAACASLGVMLVRGLGGTADPARGNHLLADACAAGVPNSCELAQHVR
jgi:TPR repeat protein